MSDLTVAIPQTNPKANYLAHRTEIDAAIAAVLEGGRYILGAQVAAFEREFAAWLGAGYAFGVASGTDALQVALRACGIGPGDRVFTVSHTAVATVAAIELCSATPVLVDITADSFTLDPEKLRAAAQRAYSPGRHPERVGGSTLDAAVQPASGSEGHPERVNDTTLNAAVHQSKERRGAIIAVHLYGHPADMAGIAAVAREYNLWLIEDCAQSHGATWSGRMTGTLGDIAAFSFYPTKNLGALGDGGAVVTNDAGLAEQVRLLREYGWQQRYVSAIPGLNSRLDELQAAILRVKLRYLDGENARRRELAAVYDAALAGSGLILPRARAGVSHVYHQYVVRHSDRDAFRQRLAEQSVGTLIHYPVPVHLQPAYAGRLPVPDLAVTEQVAAEVVSLPMFPELTNAEITEAARIIAREV